MRDEYDGFNHTLSRWLLHDAKANRGGIASTALTGLLLLGHPLGPLRSEISSAIKNGDRILDEGLIFSLARRARRARRPEALRFLFTAAAFDAPAPLFAKLFKLVVPDIERCTKEERLIVTSGLVARINWHREEADTYARPIRALLFDPDPVVAAAIVPTLSKLSRVTSDDIARLLALTTRASTRLSAVSSLAAILVRGTFPAEELEPRFWRRIARLAAIEDEWIRSGVARILAIQYGTRARRVGRARGPR